MHELSVTFRIKRPAWSCFVFFKCILNVNTVRDLLAWYRNFSSNWSSLIMTDGASWMMHDAYFDNGANHWTSPVPQSFKAGPFRKCYRESSYDDIGTATANGDTDTTTPYLWRALPRYSGLTPFRLTISWWGPRFWTASLTCWCYILVVGSQVA